MKRIAGLLLAAGASTRMGKPKQLLPVAGKTLLDRALVQALCSKLDHVVLVLGFKSQEILSRLQTDRHHPKLQIIENERFREGISSSIIAGLSAVEEHYDQVMIILADMPHITSKLVNCLLEAFFESPLPLAAVKAGQRRTHPVIISRPFYPHVRELKGDIGARHLFATYSERVCLVEPPWDIEDMDIDTQEDYLKLEKSLKE
ncbi:MAG: nucleotidyltransferase family protein [Deltaproteobacteria bacterium]